MRLLYCVVGIARTFAWLAGMALGIIGCAIVKCHPGETRCRNGSPEACLSNGEWHQFEDCAEVSAQSERQFACCATHGAACLPVGSCR